jgi:hypothetical protein
MGVFDDMHAADATGAGRWFAEGGYLSRVRRCQHKISQQGKGNIVAIEVVILETLVDLPEHESWVNGKMLPASNQPGQVCFTALLLDRQLPAMGNLKSFLMAATCLTEDQIIQGHATSVDPPLDVTLLETRKAAWANFAKNCTGGTGEALAGLVVGCRAQEVKKKNGEPFTKVIWEQATAEQIALYTGGADAAAGEAADAAAEGAEVGAT